MKASCVLLLFSLLIFSSTYYMMDLYPIVIPQNSEVTTPAPLEIARRATFSMYLPGYGMKGTGILVGRQRLENDQYRYMALTAHHVVKKTAKVFNKNKSTASHQLWIMLQPTFHGPPITIRLKIDDLQWLSPRGDWAAFTFIIPNKLDCVQLATRKEFYAIKSFEKIYAVGCGGLYDGQHCREGIIGATHNEYDNLHYQRTQKDAPAWDRNPTLFFRPYINIWYGDSGGAIFNKEGKLIGIINGYGIMSRYGGPVTHSTVAVKAYLIKELVSVNKNFFLIED